MQVFTPQSLFPDWDSKDWERFNKGVVCGQWPYLDG